MIGYSPLLRGDVTNLAALGHLSSASLVRPVLTVDGNDLRHIVHRLTRAHLAGFTVSLDLRSPERSQLLFDYSRFVKPLVQASITCRPVVQMDDEPELLRSLGAVTHPEAGGDGVTLRVRALGRGAVETARQAAIIASAATRLPRTSIHILLDQTDAPSPQLAGEIVNLVTSQGPWGSITLAGGSAPAISSLTKRGVWHRIEQKELALLDRIAEQQGNHRSVAFGDYGNRHATLEAHAPHARGNGLRWLHDGAWYVCRESAVNGWPPPEVRQVELADLLGLDAVNVASPRSWGERELIRFLAGDVEPDLINAWMVNHHLELTGARVAQRAVAPSTRAAVVPA